jgi:hypothetical protein
MSNPDFPELVEHAAASHLIFVAETVQELGIPKQSNTPPVGSKADNKSTMYGRACRDLVYLRHEGSTFYSALDWSNFICSLNNHTLLRHAPNLRETGLGRKDDQM